PDIMLALLAEDPSVLKRCHPYSVLRLGGRQLTLRLNRLALRPQAVHLVLRTLFYREDHLDELSALTAPILRVIHINTNRCDCRSENLREVSLPSEALDMEDSTLA